MKKLMIACCAVALAAVSQAATVNWAVTGVNQGGVGVNGYAYVFSNKIGDYKDPASVVTALTALTSATAVSDFLTANSIAALNTTVTSGGGAKQGVDFGSTGLIGSQSGNRLFAVIIDTATVTDSTKWYVTGTSASGKTPDPSTQNPVTFTIASQATPTAATGAWHSIAAVPEPTSGLLLLLGVAGLALRRRRA